MTAQLRHLDDVVSQSLAHQRKSGDDLRSFIATMNTALSVNADPEALEQLARDIEERFGITMGLGAIVDDESFKPWLDDAKASIRPYYWDRYKKLLHKNGLPQDVVTTTDEVTDRILGRLGNPGLAEQWDRRGMVVGHVQSGKTANYTGLICKAADAGYRLIIVIAGIHNNLRDQTQQRIDEGFIGRDTGRLATQGKKGNRAIGVGLFDDRNVPVSLTNTLFDFKKDTASTNTSQIDSYKVPVVLVIKKNHNTLRNLLDWLRENSARGNDLMIDQPMLLIDDEADNASINTKYSKEEITKINGQIRDLLNLFHRSCYVGYTATPFANIFVDPDQYDDALKEDLFPKHFIVGLDAPTNYFGPSKIFNDGMPDEEDPVWLRYISDNEDILPIKHKIDQTVDELPESLEEALRAFLIARCIRNLRGQAASHCSMLVNASRFTDVQGRIRNRLHEYLTAVLDSLRVNGSRGSDGLRDPQISALHETWLREYADAEPSWARIQAALLEAVAAAKVVEVNSRANGLDYSGDTSTGQTVIAVGGFSLSRGLTLEGLTVTWFLRNTMMYDTLMQMGRWFGYRGGYEDLCRIWMPSEAIDWYAHIAEASEELHLELKKMERAKATPSEFGLAVRSHPASLLVTARNKIGSGQKHIMIGLSNAWVETAKLSVDQADIDKNWDAADQLLLRMIKEGFSQEKSKDVSGGMLLENVPCELIEHFLLNWQNAEAAFLTQTSPILKYIGDRRGGELSKWDVLIGSVKGKADSINRVGWEIGPMTRGAEVKDGLLAIGGKRQRLFDAALEKVGVDPDKARLAEVAFRSKRESKNGKRISIPGKVYRGERDKPLFILQVVQASATANSQSDTTSKLPETPLIGWGISFPESENPDKRVEYIINTRKFEEFFGAGEEDDGAWMDD